MCAPTDSDVFVNLVQESGRYGAPITGGPTTVRASQWESPSQIGSRIVCANNDYNSDWTVGT